MHTKIHATPRPSALTRLACAAIGALALAGCAGGDSEVTDAEAPPLPGAPSSAGPPRMLETVDDAVERIDATLRSGDCEQINRLNPLSRPKLDTEARCEALGRLAGLDVQGTAGYGDVAGVVDYRRGDRTVTALLVGDSDGRFHIAFVDAFLGVPSATGRRTPALDAAALGGVRALQRRDCDRFLAHAYRRFGLGGGTDAEVCGRVEVNTVAALDPDARATPRALGGNRSYAFYELPTREAYLVVIAARQAESGVPEGVPESIARLPRDAPEHGLVDAIQANP